MDQVSSEVKYKGPIWNIHNISNNKFNFVLLENSGAEYKITTKELKKEKPDTFSGFDWLWSGSNE